jgi:hypothetical protein
VTVHRIDDRDLRLACERVGIFVVNVDDLLREVRKARLDRELAALNEQLNAKVAALVTPAHSRDQLIRRHDEIDKLRSRWARLMRKRFGVTI